MDELTALAQMAEALEPMSLNERERVLKWARDKFCDCAKERISAEQFEGIKAQLEALEKFAKQLKIDPKQLAHAFSAVRERQGVAPLDQRSLTDAEKAELKSHNLKARTSK
jgi:hypothetical protein